MRVFPGRSEETAVRGAWTILVALCVASPAAAQYRAPRTAQGAPLLEGTWSSASLTQLERPDEFKSLVVTPAEAATYEKAHRGKPPIPDRGPVGGPETDWWETDVGLARIRGQIRSSWLISPADGQLPFNAAALAARKGARERMLKAVDGPEARPDAERCLPDNTPPLANGGVNDNYQFVQTGDRLVIYAEWMGDLRVVRIGDKDHPPPDRRFWLGDSIGRWDGDTLVIETTNFRPSELRAPDGATDGHMRVVERLTRTGPDEITYVFTVSNPAVFTQTWQAYS
jgi:hypothetical protein